MSDKYSKTLNELREAALLMYDPSPLLRAANDIRELQAENERLKDQYESTPERGFKQPLLLCESTISNCPLDNYAIVEDCSPLVAIYCTFINSRVSNKFERKAFYKCIFINCTDLPPKEAMIDCKIITAEDIEG